MMMYAPPRPPTVPAASPTSPDSPTQAIVTSSVEPTPSTGKRKRKSQDHGAVAPGTVVAPVPSEGDPAGRVMTPAQAVAARQGNAPSVLVDMKKRTKTQRACDSCRSRKIRFVVSYPCVLHSYQWTPFAVSFFLGLARCDILTDVEPPTCQHCKQYAFECTFFLPITETRFKKKKLEEEAASKQDIVDKLVTRKATASPTAESKEPKVSIFGESRASEAFSRFF
jgi:hypothetical protein